MIFFTSDQHFYHKNVIRFCDRPFSSVEEMNSELIRRWNETVGPEDTVYVLGDFAFCGVSKMKEIMDQLNGHKILVQGNHDQKKGRMRKAGFEQVYEMGENPSVYFAGKKFQLSHFPFPPRGWELFVLKLKSFFGKRTELRYLSKRPVECGRWLLHGHVHTAWKIIPKRKMINVGVDLWDFRPVSYDQIIELILENGGF